MNNENEDFFSMSSSVRKFFRGEFDTRREIREIATHTVLNIKGQLSYILFLDGLSARGRWHPPRKERKKGH